MRILIAGLGNPGKKFEHTRHNAGFMAIDIIADKLKFSPPAGGFNFQSIFKAQISNGIMENQKIILAKPQTFMNASGEAVKKISAYYKIAPPEIIIIHDDLDIPLGKYKIARDRSSAGHKGVQSIIEALGTKDFTRIRIGIGVENKKISTEAFVLENFTQEEQEIIDGVIEKVIPVILNQPTGG